MKIKEPKTEIPKATKPTASEIADQLTELRKMCEKDGDKIVSRMAQAMEYALRWATTETAGWGPPTIEARLLADILYSEL